MYRQHVMQKKNSLP
nr:unnamed protein product [Callosobruchus analis]